MAALTTRTLPRHRDYGYGYPISTLSYRRAYATTVAAPPPVTLKSTLEKLEIQHWDTETAQRYKKEQERKANRAVGFGMLGLLLTVLAGYGGVLAGANLTHGLTALWASLGGVIAAVFLLGMPTLGRVRGTWTTWPYQYRPNPLPGFAEAIREQVRSELPGAEFSVDEFRIGLKPWDPILYARLGSWPSERFAIAVWDRQGNRVTL